MFSEKNDLICAAFVRAREELKNPERSAQAHHSKYAKLETVTALVNPILARFDLTFTQTVRATSETIRVRTTLIHSSGQIMWTDSAPMPLGPKRDNFTVAGATTYARRYGLITLLGIEQDEDDDGQTAMQAFIDGDEEEEPKAKAKAKPKPAKPTIVEEPKAPEPPPIPADKALKNEAVASMKELIAANEMTLERAIERIKEAGKIASPEQIAELEAA